MTYCLAIKVNEGIVFASDSRTNAGVDYIRTSSKMVQFNTETKRIIAVLSSGNLATTQAVMNAIEQDQAEAGEQSRLGSAGHLFDVASYIGELSSAVQAKYDRVVRNNGGSVSASFILGGQILGSEPEIYLIYPEGNCIRASAETPFLQIGETKYGKPILDRVITPETGLNDAARCALVSLDSTMRSNISVGPPVELAIYPTNSFNAPIHETFDWSSPYYRALQKSWNDGLQRAFKRLPHFDWES